MITLAATMFEVPGIASSTVDLGETLFLVIGALVLTLAAYGMVRRRR
jgi:LPXTG-motif cell wall-anchored protein